MVGGGERGNGLAIELSGRSVAIESIWSNQPPVQPPDDDSEDGPGRPERDDEGKRQHRNTEHLIHWWAPDRRYRPPEAQT